MKVGLGSTMIEPQFTHGRVDGIGVYAQALVRHLPASGCQVQGYVFPPVKPGGSREYSAGKAFAQSFEVTSVLDMLPGHRTHMTVDLYHAPDYRIVQMDCPVVATLHDAVPIKYPHWCNSRFRGLKNWLQKRAAQKADHVIALSNYAVAELVECFGVREDHISVVYCGVDEAWKLPVAADDTAATLQRLGLTPGYFLFVGTLQPRKNVERILAAYLALPGAIQKERALVIVGRVGWQCETLVAQLEAAQQNGANVIWLNQLASATDLRHVYAGAGVFTFPSLYEGFGIPVVEAFAAGVPVVTSNTTSLPEVSLGAALEVDPLSIDAIREAMASMATDATLRAACIAKGLQRVAELTWEATAAQTAAVYQRVLRG